MRRLVCAVSIKERVHTVHFTFTNESVRPIDGFITFPLINSNRVILPHKDALDLTLGVDSFNVHKILIYLGNSINHLQMSAYRQMGYSPFVLENLSHILTGFNRATIVFLGDVVLPI